MIKVVKDVLTNVAVTFYENTTVSGVHYLIQVFNYMDEVVESFTPTELSISQARYNEFQLLSTLKAGEYYYTAWQSTVANPTIDDVVGEPVEHGIFVVTSTEDIETNIYI